MTTENEQLFFFFFFLLFPPFGRNLIYFSVFCCRRRSLDWRVFFLRWKRKWWNYSRSAIKVGKKTRKKRGQYIHNRPSKSVRMSPSKTEHKNIREKTVVQKNYIVIQLQATTPHAFLKHKKKTHTHKRSFFQLSVFYPNQKTVSYFF